MIRPLSIFVVALVSLIGCAPPEKKTAPPNAVSGTVPAATPSATAAASTTKGGANRYQGKGFSVIVPDGWKVFAPPLGQVIFYPNGNSVDVDFGIDMIKYDPGMTPAAYLAKEKAYHTRTRGSVEDLDVTIAGEPAYRRVHVFDPDKGTAADRVNYWVGAKSGIIKAGGTVKKSDDLAKYQPIFEQIMQSLKID